MFTFPKTPTNILVVGNILQFHVFREMLNVWNGQVTDLTPLGAIKFATDARNEIRLVLCSYHLRAIAAPGLVNMISRNYGMRDIGYIIHSPVPLDATITKALADIRTEIIVGEPDLDLCRAAVSTLLNEPAPVAA